MRNSARKAHSKTVEKLDMKVGQWSFCKNYKDLECISNFIISLLFLIKYNRILSRLPTSEARRGVAQQKYEREANWKEAGE